MPLNSVTVDQLRENARIASNMARFAPVMGLEREALYLGSEALRALAQLQELANSHGIRLSAVEGGAVLGTDDDSLLCSSATIAAVLHSLIR